MLHTQQTDTDPLQNFERLPEVSRRYKGKITISQLRWLARYRHENSLSECGALVLISNKTYINIPKFAEWFSKQTN